ncbi:MAG: PQQ-binding-like beta-propeller repeat protein, partial [Gemmatimonadetes bacterium]|nr:PQQ-binding-like beta-propeller repeat protein [Gemmatimonadota bacterium]
MRLLLPLVTVLGFSSLSPDAPQMFRGGPAHTGVYASPAPSLSQVVWKFKTAGRVISSPAVTGSAVYVGGSDGRIYAIDRLAGTQRWAYATRGPVHSSPAYHDGVVFAGSVDGSFYAIDAATGTQKWSFATKGEQRFTAPGIHGAIPRTERMPDPFDVFLSSPTIAGNVVYFGSGDHNVYALDVATGALKWKFATGDVVHASPAVVDGTVYIGSWDRNMYAIDAKSGKERWRYQTGNDTTIYNQIGIASSAAVANGVVYFGCRDGHFYAVDARTGALKWKHNNNMGWVIASPAVRDGRVYFPTSDGTRFKALDAVTGEMRFNLENKAVSFSSPALVNDRLFFGSSDGWLHAVDTTGKMLAEFQSDGSKANAARYTDAKGRMQTGGMYTRPDPRRDDDQDAYDDDAGLVPVVADRGRRRPLHQEHG